MDLENPPAPDEFELSLFGPGVGEALAVHLGAGDWMLVDSCIDSATGVPASSRYLKQLGIASESVRLIVGTHWHDDHMRGLARLVREHPDARFVCTAVLKDDDFRAFVAGGGRRMLTAAGTAELSEILEIFEERNPKSGAKPVPAWPDRVLWERDGDFVRSLSPSDEAVRVFLERISELYPNVGDPKDRIPSIRPNDSAVVLWVEVGDATVLLGADLEHRKNPLLGWTAVVDSPVRPTKAAQALKVPHHGSATGHDSRMWDEMLTRDPIAVLTPYARSGLPQSGDVSRICDLTSEAFTTAPLVKGRIRARSRTVAKTIEGVARYLRDAEPKTGHVRIRRLREPASAWNVELFSPAEPLCQAS